MDKYIKLQKIAELYNKREISAVGVVAMIRSMKIPTTEKKKFLKNLGIKLPLTAQYA